MRRLLALLLLIVLTISAFAHEHEERLWDSPEVQREMLIQTGAIVGIGVAAAAYLLIRRRMGR